LTVASPNPGFQKFKLSLKGAWSESRDLLNFWQISDIISKTVQDTDTVAMED